MPEVQQCAKCRRIIESGEVFVKFKNPNPNQPPLFFHHRGGGNCYCDTRRFRSSENLALLSIPVWNYALVSLLKCSSLEESCGISTPQI
jgi:hypothetical protein